MHNSLKEQILDAVDIVTVIGERVVLTRKGKEWVGLCPFHDDHKPSFQVNPTKRIFKCFACGAAGDVLKFVMLRERVDFPEALRILAQRAGIDVRQGGQAGANARRRDELLRVTAWSLSYFQRNLAGEAGGPAREYCARRGLSDASIERHGLGLALESWDHLVAAASRAGISSELLIEAGLAGRGESGKIYDRFRNRLIFPIRDANGRPIAFGGRTLGNDDAKYLNSPETPLFSKSRVLYELHLARETIESERQAVVVEGYMDTVLLHQHGVTNAVAPLGTALTDAHVKVLKRFTNTLVLCFDGDAAGQKAADRAVETALRTAMDVRVVVLPAGQDPADCVVAGGKPAFDQALLAGVDALQFKWGLTVRSVEGRGAGARRAAMDEFLRFIGAVAEAGGIDPLQQGLVVGRISELLAVPAADVYELLTRARRSSRKVASASNAAPEASSYSQSIRGLAAGVVCAVEELLGQLIADADCYRLVDDALAQAAQLCPAWRRMYELCLAQMEERGGFESGDILAACDDAELCELFERARERVRGATPAAEAFSAALGRLTVELDLMRMANLRSDLRRAGDAESAFRALVDFSKRQHSVLAVDSRVNAPLAS